MKTLTKITMAVLFLIGISINAQAASYNLEIVSGNNQKGVAGQILQERLKVKVTFNRKAIEGKAVTFAVSTGGGRFVKTNGVTDRHGIADTKVELGNGTGTQTFTAKIVNPVKTVTFTATPIVNVLDQYNGGSATSQVWEKYIGQRNDASIPDIVDYSYAGFGGDGSEGIPTVNNLTIYDVTSYGAIPNDGLSDTSAIRSAFSAARGGNATVFFPAGHYDIFMDDDGDNRREIQIGKVGRPVSNFIVRGSGGQGSKLGGTTIQMHNDLIPAEHTWGYTLFNTVWIASPSDGASSTVVGSFPRGTKYFDVADASGFANKRYIKIQAGGLTGSDWDDHSSRPKSDMRSNWKLSEPDKNMYIHEKHEIDRIVGNRIYVKKATLTPLNSNYAIYSLSMHSHIGYENLHLDCGYKEPPAYVHVVNEENGGIKLNNAANSWIKHCRITDTTSAIGISNCYAVSVIGIVVDGTAHGHYDVSVVTSTFTLIALLEDHTKNVKVHGIHVSTSTAGTVSWRVGGTNLRGPDGHGGAPRYSLFDNCFTLNHDSNSGRGDASPHHLDGYVRWNNHSGENSTLDYWQWRDSITEAIFVGFVAAGGSTPLNAYSESYGSRVSLDSLYVAQLKRRLGYTPQWLTNEQIEYREFHDSIYVGQLYNIF